MPQGSASATEVDDARWEAFARRDRAADGAFVVAVRTTGIYCRPTCPARRPRREHVRFYPDAEKAARDGFRPCRRCRPELPAAPSEAAVQRVLDYIDGHLDERLSLAALAQAAGLSPSHLQRTFTRRVGTSPRRYIESLRLERLKGSLREGARVTDAMYDAGFGSSAQVYGGPAGRLGMRPGAYRSGGGGMTIAYGVGATAVGLVLAARTERGLCAVRLGDDPAALVQSLDEEFPNAVRRRDDDALSPLLKALAQAVEEGADAPELPLDVRGTAFQARVWQALREIPPGQTRTYREIAWAIGRPQAARAVGRACAVNRLALVVPCHRVVRADGDLGGYRWGVERKRRLLRREAARSVPDGAERP